MSESQPFRLAFRREGPSVNAYIAPLETMDGARLLSSMPVTLLDADEQLWIDWKALMTRALDVLCQSALGVAVLRFDERPAPEHERAGNA